MTDPAHVHANSAAGAPGSGRYAQPQIVFQMRMDIAIAVFLLLAFTDHALSALVPPLWRVYKRNVALGVNPFRWIEYRCEILLPLRTLSICTASRRAL